MFKNPQAKITLPKEIEKQRKVITDDLQVASAKVEELDKESKRLDKLNRDKADNENQYELSVKKLEEITDQIASKQGELNFLNQQISSKEKYNQELDEKEARVKVLILETEEKEKEKESIVSKILGLTQEMPGLENKIKDTEDSLRIVTEQLSVLIDNFNKKSLEVNNAIEEMEKLKAQKHGELTMVSTNLSSTISAVDLKMSELNKLNEEFRQKRQEMENLVNNSMSEIENVRDKFNQEMEEKEKAFAEKEGNLARREDMLEAKKKQLNSVKLRLEKEFNRPIQIII